MRPYPACWSESTSQSGHVMTVRYGIDIRHQPEREGLPYEVHDGSLIDCFAATLGEAEARAKRLVWRLQQEGR